MNDIKRLLQLLVATMACNVINDNHCCFHSNDAMEIWWVKTFFIANLFKYVFKFRPGALEFILYIFKG